MKIHFQRPVISLKNQLLLYFILVAFVPASIISIYYYVNSQKVLEENIGTNNQMIVSRILENMESQVEQATNFTEGVYVNRDIIELLRKDQIQFSNSDISRIQALNSLEYQFTYLPITKYIDSFFIIGNNGVVLRNGPDAYTVDIHDFLKESWFLNGRKEDGKTLWGALTKNSTKVSDNEYVNPMYKLIKDIEKGNELGSLVILFRESMFSDTYKSMFQDKGIEIYLADQQGNVLSSSDRSFANRNLKEKSFYKDFAKSGSNYFQWKDGQESKLVVYKKSDKTDWTLVEVVPLGNITLQKARIRNTALLLVVVTICLALLFSFFLSWNFAKPISKLVKQVNEIAQGNFNFSFNIKKRNELGVLGKNIEKMAQDIQNYLNRSIQKEEEKRKIEIRMLQSQINPHFLYNTLSSIKWMAAIQGADGIREMVTCLGRLLKAAVGDINEEIPIRDELNIVEDYINIQRIRYKGKVSFQKEVADVKILDYSIVKFTLQPLIENAIFHGIEPKDGSGEIRLNIALENKKLVISVWDNGVGMDIEKIKSILEKADVPNLGRGFKGIGLSNVNQRIKLIYGEEYGIAIDSEVNRYTRIKVLLPVILFTDGKSLE